MFCGSYTRTLASTDLQLGLTLYYKFEEGSGTVAINSANTGSDYDGALVNGPAYSTASASTCTCRTGFYDTGMAVCAGE